MTDRQLLIRFAIVTVSVIAAVWVLGLVLRLAFAYEMNTGVGIVSIIVPAMDAGQRHAMATKTALDSARMWRLSGLFAAVSFVISSTLAVILSSLSGTGAELMQALQSPGLMAAIVLLMLVVYVLAARFFIGFGQRLVLNRQ